MIHDVIFTHGEKFGNMIQVLLVDAPGITTTHVYISKKNSNYTWSQNDCCVIYNFTDIQRDIYVKPINYIIAPIILATIKKIQ